MKRMILTLIAVLILSMGAAGTVRNIHAAAASEPTVQETLAICWEL